MGKKRAVDPQRGRAKPGDEETEQERWERNYADLLQELRVAQNGVQILFAFLLTVVFSAQFNGLGTFERGVYLTALLSAAVAASLIIAPVAYHRILFRQGEKPNIVRTSHWMATAGMAFLLVAMVFSVLLATDVVLERGVAILISAVAAVWFVMLWFALPVFRRNGQVETGRAQDRAGRAQD